MQTKEKLNVIVDTREQTPLEFPSAFVNVQVGTLQTGDYSLAGLTDRVAIERKSLDDLIHSVTYDRARFERELQRMRGMQYAAIVIECSLDEIRRHQYSSQTSPESILGSIYAFEIQYGVHVHFVGSHTKAGGTVYHLLRLYLNQQRKDLQAVADALSLYRPVKEKICTDAGYVQEGVKSGVQSKNIQNATNALPTKKYQIRGGNIVKRQTEKWNTLNSSLRGGSK